MAVDITSITTGEGTNYITPNHWASGLDPLASSLGSDLRYFYGTTQIDTLFNSGVQTNSWFSIEEPTTHGTIRMDVTTAMVASSVEFTWLYSTNTTSGGVSGTTWHVLTITDDETNGFTTTGTSLKIKFDYPSDWAQGSRGDSYGGRYILCYVTSASGVTVQPVISDLRVNVRSIELIDEDLTVDELCTAVGDDSIIEKLNDYNYIVKYNVYLQNSTLTVENYQHVDFGALGYDKLVSVWTARQGADYNDGSVFNIGVDDGFNNSRGVSVTLFNQIGHIGRNQYHTINGYNAAINCIYTGSVNYFYGALNLYNCSISGNPICLSQGTGEFVDCINDTTFYIYSASFVFDGFKIPMSGLFSCGWNRVLRVRGADFTDNTRTDYVISGGAVRACFHMYNAVNLDTDKLAVKYYTTTPTSNDGHVYQYKSVDMKVIDTSGNPIEGATVTITNGNGDIYSGTTTSGGTITQQDVYTLDTYNNGVGGTGPYLYSNPVLYKGEDDYSNITIEVSAAGYDDYSISYVLTEPIDWSVVLYPTIPKQIVRVDGKIVSINGKLIRL